MKNCDIKVEDLTSSQVYCLGSVSFITLDYIRKVYDVKSTRRFEKKKITINIIDFLDSSTTNSEESLQDFISILIKKLHDGFSIIKSDSGYDTDILIEKEYDSEYLEDILKTEMRLQKKVKKLMGSKLKDYKDYEKYLDLKKRFENEVSC